MTLMHYFRLVDVQAKMALKSDSSRLILGYVWWVLEPVLYVAVFYFVFDVLLESRRSDFLIFLACGKLPFIWFNRSVNQAANSIVGSAGLIGRLDLPKTLFPMVIVQLNVYKQVVVFLFLIVLLLLWGYRPAGAWLWFAPVVLVQYLMIVACSLAASVLVCFVRDFRMLIGLFTMFLMFTSGIFWDVRDLGDPQLTELVLLLNPLAYVLDAYRQILMFGIAPDLSLLALHASAFGAVIYLLVVYMRSANQKLALKALS